MYRVLLHRQFLTIPDYARDQRVAYILMIPVPSHSAQKFHFATLVCFQCHIATHLQLICLAEKLRTDARDVLSLVQSYNGDLRKCLNALQLWAASEGSCNSLPKPISYSKKALVKKPSPAMNDEGFGSQTTVSGGLDENSQNAQDIADLASPKPKAEPTQNSEDEFELPRRRLTRGRKRLVIEDETSCDSLTSSPVRPRSRRLLHLENETTTIADESSQDSQMEGEDGECREMTAQTAVAEEDMECVPLKDGQPAMHKGLFSFSHVGESNKQELLKVSLEEILLALTEYKYVTSFV